MEGSDGNGVLLEVKGLKKYFPIRRGVFKRVVGWVRAVDDISFSIGKRETLGLVGESGCGKTTAIRSVIRVLDPTEGKVFFHRENEVIDLAGLDRKRLKELRREIRMIFQDPDSSLNPRVTIRDIIGEPLLVNKVARGKELDRRVQDLMGMVGLDPAHLRRYPHAFSGGQRQRIVIARALALSPKLVLADEPTSALDVSVQGQILNLLLQLQRDLGLSYLFISHDLSVIRHISDRIAVMYVGRIVEMAATTDLFARPMHPYSEALLSAVPQPHPHRKAKKIVLEGDVADPSNRPSGCPFHPRCKYVQTICKEEEPPLREVGGKGHLVSCHFAGELELSGYERGIS